MISMNADKLRDLCRSFRDDRKAHTDEALVALIEADVAEYRRLFDADRAPAPSAPLDELVPLMGWLIYESSWDAVQQMASGFDHLDAEDPRRLASQTQLRFIERIADAARAMPWPHFAGRSLGAFRSQALAESKRDTQMGYDAAWLVHQEGRRRYRAYRDSHGADLVGRARFVRDLDEVLLQLALAETGTACRTAERVIGRWAEDFADHRDAERAQATEDVWVERMFRQLTSGLDVGDLAIDTALMIERKHGFVDTPDELRLTRKSAKENPGIMTARAALLLLPLRHEMERMGLGPGRFASWDDWELDVLRRFRRAYYEIEANGEKIAARPEYERQFFHVRLDVALLKPGYDLPSTLAHVPCLALNPLDETAAREMSEWLARGGTSGRWRGFSAATMPGFIRSVVLCRGLGEGDRGYQDWRLEWFEHQQFSEDPGRREQVEALMAAL